MNNKIKILLTLGGVLIAVFLIGYFLNTIVYQDRTIISEETNNYNSGIDFKRDSEELDGYYPPDGPPPGDEEEWGDDQVPPVPEKETESTDDIRAKLRVIFAQIEAETALSASVISQCKLLPLGNAPCGGPAFYHVYSSVGSNESKLLELAAEHRTLAQEYNQANEIMGICLITPEPEIKLTDGTCVAVLD